MKSIRSTTTLLTITCVVIILAVGQIAIDGVISSWLVKQFDEALHAKARALVTLTKSDGVEVEMDFADEFMPEFSDLNNPQYFQLYLQSGQLLERSRSFFGEGQSNFEEPSDDIEVRDIELPDGRNGRQITVRFIPQIEDKKLRLQFPEFTREKAVVMLGQERESLNSQLLNLHLLIMGIGLIVLVITAIAVTQSVKSGLSPLVRITEDIARISSDSSGARIGTQNQPIELKPIATQFNLAFSEMENALNRERQFSSDVAHELRTPVSEILALSEVGMRWPDEKEATSYFTDIHESSRHLDQIISNLLHLSRCEEGQFDIQISEVRLNSLLKNICTKLSFEAKTKNIEYQLPEQKLPRLLVDKNWLELILLNLLTNAIAHSPLNSLIEIEFSSQKDRGSIQIRNRMIEPLSADDLDHVFERFWRKDLARTSGKHVGIGLALVKSYTKCLSLEVEAMIDPNKLFCIKISNIKLIY